MNAMSLGDEIARLDCRIEMDAGPRRVEWGGKLTLRGLLRSADTARLARFVATYRPRIGVLVFDGDYKAKELRGELAPATEEGTPFEVVFDTDHLRPGPHGCGIDVVIDHVRWFQRPTRVEIDVTPSDAFVDVRTFVHELGVEELANGAERYFQRFRDSEWVVRKPYSLKDIQHNWPQVANLVRGLGLKEGMTVVDFGAGTGWISRTLSRLGLQVQCLDVSQTALDIAARIEASERMLFPHPPIAYHRFDGRRIPFDDASVDRVLCNDALHHVPNVREVIAEMSRVLKPGGVAGFCEPGPRHSLNPRAQFEMRELRVLENDVDHTAINAYALEAGFTKMRMSIYSPYALDVDLAEWGSLKPESPALRRYASQALARAETNNLFFLHK